MSVFIIIPAFNEAKVIKSVLTQLRSLYESVIVVDDASDDETAEIAENCGCIVLRHLVNRGQGASLKTGILYALRNTADVIVTFDADGQHLVDDIEKLIAPILSGQADVVLGSRFLESQSIARIPYLRRCILRLAVIFTRVTSHMHITDTHNGLRAFSQMAAQKVRIQQNRMAHASEILDEIYKNNLRYMEVSTTIKYNHYSISKGQSSMAFWKILVKYFLGKLM